MRRMSKPSFGRFLILWILVGLPWSFVLIFYTFFHIYFQVPMAQLTLPFLMFSLLHIAVGPFVHWSRVRAYLSGTSDRRPLLVTFGVYAILFCIGFTYFAEKLELIDHERAAAQYWVVIILGLGSIAIALYGSRFMSRGNRT
jgi:hypothetical protein